MIGRNYRDEARAILPTWEAEGPAREQSRFNRVRRFSTRSAAAAAMRPPATIHAPLLEGLYGTNRSRSQGGQIVTADRQYLRDSILLPQQTNLPPAFAPDDAHLPGPVDRGAGERTRRLPDIPSRPRRRIAPDSHLRHEHSLFSVTSSRPPVPGTEPSYLAAQTTLVSWLFTKDHKRIALLYLFSISLLLPRSEERPRMLMRLELLSPTPYLVTSETYNRLFTLHGVIMVWFFLIPGDPERLREFSAAPHDRRAGRGVSRALTSPAGISSWRARALVLLLDPRRRCRHGLDFLHALLQHLLQRLRRGHGGGHLSSPAFPPSSRA